MSPPLSPKAAPLSPPEEIPDKSTTLNLDTPTGGEQAPPGEEQTGREQAPPGEAEQTGGEQAPPGEEQTGGEQAPPGDYQTCYCDELSDCCFWILLFGVFFYVVCVIVVCFFSGTTKNPRFYLSDFRGPPLATTPGSATILCELTIRNKALLVVVRYDDLFITLRHPSGQEATSDIPRFDQGFRKENRKVASLQFGIDTPAADPKNRSTTAVFRLSLKTRYSFRGSSQSGSWRTRRKRVRVSADVPVTAEGRMATAERILLVSAGVRPKLTNSGWLAVVVATISALIFVT